MTDEAGEEEADRRDTEREDQWVEGHVEAFNRIGGMLH